MGFIGTLIVLGLLVFWPIVYKPLWDIIVFRFELYEKLSFLPSLEVLLRKLILIFESPIQSGRSSSLILEPPPSDVRSSSFAKPPNRHPSFSPISFIHFSFEIQIHPKSETILHHCSNIFGKVYSNYLFKIAVESMLCLYMFFYSTIANCMS